MATEVLPDSPDTVKEPVASAPTSATAAGRWWKFGLASAAGLVVLAGVAALLRGSIGSEDAEERTTHTVRRGDLVVTVIEEGTLESSKNTEIKCEIRGGYGGRGGHSMVNWVIPSGSFVKKDDVLVELDTKVIEETVSLGKTDTNNAIAALARAQADLAIAKTSVDSYLNGSYREQRKVLQNELEVADWNLKTAQRMLRLAKSLHRKGFVTQLEVEANEYTVTQAELLKNVKETEIEVLETLTKKMRMETLTGQVTATEARLKGREAGVELEQGKLDLAIIEEKKSTIRAPRDGLVIYPSTAKWKDTPDITEGASVHNNQVLLLMPDLTKMQLKVGIHESIVDRIKAGQTARVALPNSTFETKVASVADVASPAGWWSGNVVRYDTAIDLPTDSRLKPGMSASVEIEMARYRNVLQIPIAAVVKADSEAFCWIETSHGPERRSLKLGDSNDEYLVCLEGVQEGEQVVLDPISSVKDARTLVAPTLTHTVERGELLVTLTEQGLLESSNNTQIKCRVRGQSTVNWVIESGVEVKAGDELVRLENKQIEEHIHERTKFAHLSQDAAIGFRAQATVAGLRIPQYLKGEFHTQLLRKQQELALARQNLRVAEDTLNHTREMFARGFRSELQVDEHELAVRDAALAVKERQTEIDVLKTFTKEERLVSLNGEWESAKAAANGHEEVLRADNARIARAKEELTQCIITAPRDDLVIYPKGEEWKDQPDIAEGSTVHSDQVLLLMPDLTQMQVTVGVHEDFVDLVKPGQVAQITLPDRVLKGKVVLVASTAKPAGWWSGNVVKYETVIELPSEPGLKPGMTAEVEIRIARHEDVVKVPLSAIIETADGAFCWVGTPENAQRRKLVLGNSNRDFAIVQDGLSKGDRVVLNPASVFTEARGLSPIE